MIDRRHIEQILRMNGLDHEASDDEIKSLLISARWHHDDVETALVVLREDPKTHQRHLDAVHRVFNTDDRLAPETISALLGIDVEVNNVSEVHQKSLQRGYYSQLISMVFVSIVLAGIFLVGAMWYLKMGFFYNASNSGLF